MHWRYCSLALSHRYQLCGVGRLVYRHTHPSQLLVLVLLKPFYSRVTRSIPWLLMPWLFVSTDHEQQWHWICKINFSFSSKRKDFNTISVLRNDEKLLKIKIYFNVSWHNFSMRRWWLVIHTGLSCSINKIMFNSLRLSRPLSEPMLEYC